MKQLLAFLLLAASASQVSAQDTKRIELETGDNYNPRKEVFFVLTENDSTRQGPYQRIYHDAPEFSGWYNKGKKDSVWMHYGRKQKILSQRFYSNGERRGVWEFNDINGNPDWKYDFATKQAFYSNNSGNKIPPNIAAILMPDVIYYQAGSGTWINDSADKKPINLSSHGEWLSFLMMNLSYPQEAIDKEQMGTIWVDVTINEKGEVVAIEKEKSKTPSLDDEALRIYRLFPLEFIPAQKDGHAVAARVKMPVTFRLEHN